MAELTGRLAAELTPEQWFVLNRLWHDEAANLVDLADAALGDRPNITRIVAGLESRKLVKRAPDPDDGRRQIVTLTRRGREVHDRIAAEVPHVRSEMSKGISRQDLETTQRVLLQLEHNLTPPG